MSMLYLNFEPNELHALRFMANAELDFVSRMTETVKEAMFIRKVHGLDFSVNPSNFESREKVLKLYVGALNEVQYRPLDFGCRIENVGDKRFMVFDGLTQKVEV